MEASDLYRDAREIVYIAVRRASAFMGFALNAARDPNLKDFSLSKEISMDFLPDVSDSALSEMKAEFERWAIANGLRELIEAFSVFLDRLYEYSVFADCRGVAPDPTRQRTIAQVKKKGLPGKQLRLREDFDIKSELAPELKTIYETRNCLAHERGIVTPEVCNTDAALEIRWRAIEIFVQQDSGEEIRIEFRDNAPPVHGPGKVVQRTVHRVRRFPLGALVKLNVVDLAEICSFAYLAADTFLFPAIDYAKTRIENRYQS